MKDTSHLLNLSATRIGYLPDLVCPTCGAALIAKQGRIYTPYPALPGSWTQEYDRYFGYLRFDCACHLNMSSPSDPALAGSLRVARLGDAVIPLDFVGASSEALARYGISAMEVNTSRTQEAIRFLCSHADPNRTAGADTLKLVIYEVAGGKSPEAAYEIIKSMILNGSPIWIPSQVPASVPVET
jgi:hypothetical protein